MIAVAVAAGGDAAAQEVPADRDVVLITGSTGGLGREVARAFAGRGAHVIVHGRSVERGEALVAEIEAETPGSARFYRADFADFANVRRLAEELRRDYARIDILINNAGVYLPTQERVFTDAGIEMHFAVNHLAHFLLTHELLPLLEAAAPSHIVNVASAGQAPMDFEDPYMDEGYSNRRAYSQSKLAQITFTMELAERLEGTGIRVNTLHPATTMDTDMARELGRTDRAPIEEGVVSVMYVATEFEGSGQYFDRTEPTAARGQAYDDAAQTRLWELSEELTGVEWGEDGAASPRPDDEIVLVTGSTGGLGREVARAFAGRGAHVIVHGRNVERGEALVAEIEAETSGSARFYPADLADFDAVRAFADAVKRDYDRIDLLVNNAGIALPGERRTNGDGIELHFAVNHLSHFLLTHELMPLLEAAAPSRIVNVSSIGAAPIDFADPQIEEGYSMGRAYGQSKLAQVGFTFSLAERLEGTGITVHALHPATFMDTDMVREFGGTPRSSVQDGVETVMYVSLEAEGTGAFFNRLERSRAPDEQPYDREARERLWELSEELTGARWDGGAG